MVDEADIAAVSAVLRSDYLTTGPAVSAFEDALAARVGARYAVAYSNGTSALHGAVWAAGLQAGDVVATTPLSFSASANCARYIGADVRFVDIDPDTLNLDVRSVPDCDALIAVHYTGLPVDLRTLANRPRIVIEDAAQALGASTPDGPVGNCAHSEMTTFSFHPVKSITTAEGGAVTTNDPELAQCLRRFRNHGIDQVGDAEGWNYDIAEVGYNYRLSDLQAALGISQLEKLGDFIDARNRLADRYRVLLGGDRRILLPPVAPAGTISAHHLFVIRVPERRRVYDELRAAGIGVQVHHIPIYRLSAYGFDPSGWPQTEDAYARILSLPLFPSLTDSDQDAVVRALKGALG